MIDSALAELASPAFAAALFVAACAYVVRDLVAAYLREREQDRERAAWLAWAARMRQDRLDGNYRRGP